MSEHEKNNADQEIRQQPLFPSQSELFEDLRRIGELEDQKRNIQQEIDQLTSKLKEAIPDLDKTSLLYQMLSSSLTSAPRAPSKSKRASTKKKTVRKRTTKK